MKASSADPCMYFLESKQHEEVQLVLCFHVDDGLLMGVETMLDMFLQKLAVHFEVTQRRRQLPRDADQSERRRCDRNQPDSEGCEIT